MNPPNPPSNFDPSCSILVETDPDPEKGPSTALTVAVCDGYAPGCSWLVTKENGDQAIVVLMVRASRVEPIVSASGWRPGVGTAAILVLLTVCGWCALLAVVLR